MKRELSSKFREKRIDGMRGSVYMSLKNESNERKEFDSRYHALIKIVSSIIRDTQFPKEQIDLFDKCGRIAKSNMPGVRILGKDFGLPDDRYYNVNISRQDFMLYGQSFPPFNPDSESYWSSIILSTDRIKNPADQEKIRLALSAYMESYKRLDNFLVDYLTDKRRVSTFLKKQIPSLTMGKLYDYNEEWFNIFIKDSHYSDEDIYKSPGQEEEDTGGNNSGCTFSYKLSKLKEILGD